MSMWCISGLIDIILDYFVCGTFLQEKHVTIHYVVAANICLVDLLYMNMTSRVQHVLSQNITLQVKITDVSLRYYFRALTWYHNGNKLTPGVRIILNNDKTTLTVINSTAADSGVYESRFDGLLIHPYSRSCEEAVLDLLRHFPILKPAVFYVGTTSIYTGEHI